MISNSHHHMNRYDYDVIVIGSGAGGMATAVPLAQAGQKVLVLEQHYVPGGWTHSFTLEAYKFSPGVHYIGGIGPGGPMRRIYEGLGVSQDLVFCELNPDGFDHVFIGDEQFDIPKGRENFAERLKQRFPHEAQGIDGYLNTAQAIMDEIRLLSRVRGVGNALTLPYRARHALRWATRSGADLINHFVSDPTLRAILAAQSGDHGLPPSMVSAAVHAGITHHHCGNINLVDAVICHSTAAEVPEFMPTPVKNMLMIRPSRSRSKPGIPV